VSVIASVVIPNTTKQQYDEIRTKIGLPDEAPAGGLAHLTWWEGDDCHNLDAWESEAVLHAFAESVMIPALAAAGVTNAPVITVHEAHDVFLPGAVSDPKIDVVKGMYEAFGRGDVDAILAQLSEDVDWSVEAAGSAVPWYGARRGKAQVLQFFGDLASSVDVTDFTPLSFASNETEVASVVHFAYSVKATGKTAAMNINHAWRFAGATVVRWRGTEDSAQSVAAFS
jgi:hypothetical protein